MLGPLEGFYRRQRELQVIRNRLLRLLFSAGPGAATALALVQTFEILLPAATAVATGGLIAVAARLGPTGLSASDRASAVAAFALFAAALLLSYVLGPCQTILEAVVQRRVDANIRASVLAKLGAVPGTEHLEDDVAISRLSLLFEGGLGVFSLGRLSTGQLSLMAGYATTLVASLIIARASVPLALLLLGGTFVVRAGFRRRASAFLDVQAHAVGQFRRAGYFSSLCEDSAAGKEIRVFGLGPWLSERYGAEWETGASRLRRHLYGNISRQAPIFAFSAAMQAFAFAWLGHSAAVGAIGLGVMAAALTASRSLGAVHGDGEDHQRHVYGKMAFDALDELERLGERAMPATPARSADGLPAREIRFANVDFAYPSGAHALRGLDLVLEAGVSTAIVGPNGAGKTTLIKLLTGLATPQRGAITIDGVPLEQLDISSWRSRLAVIFQDFTKFEVSFEDNVWLARAPDRPSREQMLRAVERAGARDVLDEVGGSFGTVLSRHFEGGVDLSGGQWQKIALARTFCAVELGATVLVLDEPTAALDVKAEAELFDRFLDLTRGMTTVLVSHRFSTVRHAQRIVVVDDGRVVETGSHDGLVAAGGLYARMFRVQAERFGVIDAR